MRWLIRILVSLVVLAGLMIGALFLLPADKIAGLASDQIRAATGRDLTLSGRLAPSIWPQIGVATGPVTLSNAQWSDEGPMLAAQGLSIGLDLKALLGGTIVIREVTVQSPRIVLEKAADGRANWIFAGAAAPDAAAPTAGGGGGMRAFTLDKGQISDGQVIYIDRAAGTRTEVTGLDATLALPYFDGPADVTLAANLNGQRITARTTVGSFSGLLGGAVSALVADVSIGAAKVGFDGRAGLVPLAADGALSADVSDLGALFGALGQAAPILPAGVGKRLEMAGQLTYAPEGSVHLRDATLRQDGNVLSGAADLYLSGKPRLNGQFTAGALDLSAFTGGGTDGGAGGDGGGGTGGWPSDPIDVSALGALDAEVSLTADSVNLGMAQLGASRITATLTDRRLVLNLREVRGYQGSVSGNIVLNGRGGVSVGGDLKIAGVAMQPLLSDLADYDRLIGQGDLSVTFLGSGGSVAAIMNSLSGSGSVSFGKGELRGLDLVGMLRTLDTSYVGAGAKTIFDAITANFTIEKGVLKNDDLAFLAPLLRASGKGKVGIGAQTIDYRVVPTALSGADGTGGVKVPLLITGTWANPRFRLDLEALAKEKLDLEEQQKALEEKARAAAAKALGVEAEEGESLEDAAKRKLEDKAKRRLKKLLGGN
ncbi:MAG: AsmA family protein [Rhodobacteraceae bacterium]|nr:AsmA family protein [Paracoccaceae bacterium]